jgi:hypothetical protein
LLAICRAAAAKNGDAVLQLQHANAFADKSAPRGLKYAAVLWERACSRSAAQRQQKNGDAVLQLQHANAFADKSAPQTVRAVQTCGQ